jgi:hypothetical protein
MKLYLLYISLMLDLQAGGMLGNRSTKHSVGHNSKSFHFRARSKKAGKIYVLKYTTPTLVLQCKVNFYFFTVLCNITTEHKPTKFYLSILIFKFLWCLLRASNPKLHLQEDGCTCRFSAVCFTCWNNNNNNNTVNYFKPPTPTLTYAAVTGIVSIKK